jgi:putative DNA primase/helicase
MDDIGMSRWLGNKLRGTWHWLEKRQIWLRWSETHWQAVAPTALQAVVKREIETLPTLIHAVPENEKRPFLDFCGRYLSPRKRDALINDVKSEDGIAISPGELDRRADILPVQNGYVCLRTGSLHEHDPSLLYTRVIDAAYDPTAPARQWRAFLDLVQPEPEMQTYLQRLAGYAATGVSHQTSAFFYGSGANGKTVFTEVLTGLLNGYATKIDAEAFLVQRSTNKSYDVASVEGARLVVAPELRNGTLAAEQFKKLVDSGTLRIERKYEQPYDIARTHTLILYGNHKPRITDTSSGTWRRLHLVGWNVRVPEAQQIQNYHDVLLKNEREGILAWIVAGAIDFFANGVPAPEKITADTNAYREEENTVLRFIDSCCYRGACAYLVTAEAYDLYCETTDSPLKRSEFTREFEKHFGKETVRKIHGKSTRVFVGCGLLELADIEARGEGEPVAEHPAQAASEPPPEPLQQNYKTVDGDFLHQDAENQERLQKLQDEQQNLHETSEAGNFTKNPVVFVANSGIGDYNATNGELQDCSHTGTGNSAPASDTPHATSNPSPRVLSRSTGQYVTVQLATPNASTDAAKVAAVLDDSGVPAGWDWDSSRPYALVHTESGKSTSMDISKERVIVEALSIGLGWSTARAHTAYETYQQQRRE